jgi:hypothetical protein
MANSLDHMINETDPGKMGIIVSMLIMAGSLVPKIDSAWIKVQNPYSLQFLLFGVSVFFFSYAIKLNVRHKIEVINNEQYMATILPHNFILLSKICFFISAVIFVLAMVFMFLSYIKV